MTITCKKCGKSKGRSFYRENDVLRKRNICRACRGTTGNPLISPGAAITSWRASNAIFFAAGRVR
jgi:hypothetical protein